MSLTIYLTGTGDPGPGVRYHGRREQNMIPRGIMIEPGAVPVQNEGDKTMKASTFTAAMVLALVVILAPTKGCQVGPPAPRDPTPVEAPFETE